ncbi:MmcQ/YjbR family DNA-binding protein [Nocardiopsis sp. NPDC050513]|uniref:MmcQ/YjbR family DNA-binding protein n=1 Tax=Nocardiopsis sp. NPDC050513 TaxID=3364338 RepID=UPI0037B55A20
MTPEQFVDAALWFPEASESEPFGPGPLVYKVAGQKVYALLMERDQGPFANLKCDPELALELRAQFPGITPGYHMNKRHWNSVPLDGSVPDEEILEMLRHSYVLVARSLRRADGDRVLAVLGDDAPAPGEPRDAV